jgi:hypothetical protein
MLVLFCARSWTPIGHWLPCTLVAVFSGKGCFGARKQDIKFFLSFDQAKTGQLDKQ